MLHLSQSLEIPPCQTTCFSTVVGIQRALCRQLTVDRTPRLSNSTASTRPRQKQSCKLKFPVVASTPPCRRSTSDRRLSQVTPTTTTVFSCSKTCISVPWASRRQHTRHRRHSNSTRVVFKATTSLPKAKPTSLKGSPRQRLVQGRPKPALANTSSKGASLRPKSQKTTLGHVRLSNSRRSRHWTSIKRSFKRAFHPGSSSLRMRFLRFQQALMRQIKSCSCRHQTREQAATV